MFLSVDPKAAAYTFIVLVVLIALWGFFQDGYALKKINNVTLKQVCVLDIAWFVIQLSLPNLSVFFHVTSWSKLGSEFYITAWMFWFFYHAVIACYVLDQQEKGYGKSDGKDSK